MRHTIDEAASLVGRTRRSLYRAMNESRLSYGVEVDGRRYIDTAELLRAYGAFKTPSRDEKTSMSHSVTVPTDLAEVIGQAVAAALSEVLPKLIAEAAEPLRQEIERLRLENAEQRLIEFKPQTPAAPQPAMSAADNKPQSFADLLSGLD